MCPLDVSRHLSIRKVVLAHSPLLGTKRAEPGLHPIAMNRLILPLALAFVAAVSAAPVAYAAPVQAAELLPKTDCAALRHTFLSPDRFTLPTTGAHVTSANMEHSGKVPFCKVLGEITSVDPYAQPIRFELNLPTQWNGKAVHFGGGGFDGALSVTNGLHTPEVGIHADPTPLQRGFATFGSDSGHHHHYLFIPDEYNELKANFARNLEQRRNYAHDALKKTHDAVVLLIPLFYGKPATRMYFLGGSTGGREAYFVTQLWPKDYDGVLGAYAGWDQVELDLEFIRISEAEYSKGGYLPGSKTRLIANRVMQACDAADGLKDGIISNPTACHFDLKSLACGTGSGACLTPAELHTAQAFATEQRTDQPLARGVQSIPGFNITSGTDLTGSLGLLHHAERTPMYPFNSFYRVVGSGVLRYFLTGDKHFDDLTFNTENGGIYQSQLLRQSMLSDASDANLSPFAQHGGKFLILHGTADATIPTNASVQFYTMLQSSMGEQAVDRFSRLYLVPGFGHGHGTFNAGFDSLTVLDHWVETNQPPVNLVATDNNKHDHGRTRPLCPYPTWPRYTTGDPDQASSFTCAQPAAAPVAGLN